MKRGRERPSSLPRGGGGGRGLFLSPQKALFSLSRGETSEKGEKKKEAAPGSRRSRERKRGGHRLFLLLEALPRRERRPCPPFFPKGGGGGIHISSGRSREVGRRRSGASPLYSEKKREGRGGRTFLTLGGRGKSKKKGGKVTFTEEATLVLFLEKGG